MLRQLTKGLKKFWILITLATLIAGIKLLINLIQFRTKAAELKVPLMPLTDIYFMLISTVATAFLKETIRRLTKPYLYKRIEKLYEQSSWKEKKQKILYSFTSLIWYSLMAIVGLILAYNDPAVPKCFSGGQDCKDIIISWPFDPMMKYVRFYYILQMGTRIYSLLNHMLRHRDHVEFLELASHHILTVIAMLYSYYCNFYSIASVTLLIHDFGDWVLNLGKIWRDLYFDYCREIYAFPLIVYLFCYIRVIAQLRCSIWNLFLRVWNWGTPEFPVTKEGKELQDYARFPGLFIFLMVVSIWLMNLVWSMIIMKIPFTYILYKSSNTDTYGEEMVSAKKNMNAGEVEEESQQ